MPGILWFLFWQLCGMILAERVFGDHRLSVRLWLGSVCGSVLSMWTPIPFAFLWGFGRPAHAAAALLGAVLIAVVWILRRRSPVRPVRQDPDGSDRTLLWLFLPFMALAVLLILRHSIPSVNGAIYTGQCTYGDMPMHLGFITSLAEQQTFPPYYSILPAERICYPFLCDSVSASLYALGTSLRWAYMFPMFFAFAQVFAGFWFLAREICRKKGAAVLAYLFFFLNGGLGLIYFPADHSFRELFTGFYKTPTNLVENGIRWVNVIADMLLPQRATLFGWATLFAVLFLLYRAAFKADRTGWLPAGILAGALPMIHTHSYFALGVIAACWLICTLVRDGADLRWLRSWLFFGLPAVMLAIPQLMIWTFRSVGGNESFLRLSFDWVNGGKENWFWFWFKNVGPLFVLTPLSFLFADREQRAVFSGSIVLFILCELVLFQPNPYDNNKLLYVGYVFCCILSADGVMTWLEKRGTRPAKTVCLALLLILTSSAAVFSLAREVVSGIPQYGYELFSREEVAAAAFIRENTAPDALFLTKDNHDNPVAVLTGRNILCGSPSYLYYHGLNYAPYQQMEQRMLTDPAAFEEYRASIGLDYVYIGYYEKSVQNLILPYLQEHYPVIYASEGILLFDVR